MASITWESRQQKQPPVTSPECMRDKAAWRLSTRSIPGSFQTMALRRLRRCGGQIRVVSPDPQKPASQHHPQLGEMATLARPPSGRPTNKTPFCHKSGATVIVSACPNPMQILGLVLVSEDFLSRQSPGLDSPDPP